MDMKQKSYGRRERLTQTIRREKIDKLLKHRRKLILTEFERSHQL